MMFVVETISANAIAFTSSMGCFFGMNVGAPWFAAVCVPVRNEQNLLPPFLDAMAAQSGAGDVALCVLLDTCTDESAAILQNRRSTLPFQLVIGRAVSKEPNAGRARADSAKRLKLHAFISILEPE